MDDLTTTYRLVALNDPSNVGLTAATEALAKRLPGNLDRQGVCIGLERTDWTDHYGKPRPVRSVMLEAETEPGEWEIG